MRREARDLVVSRPEGVRIARFFNDALGQPVGRKQDPHGGITKPLRLTHCGRQQAGFGVDKAVGGWVTANRAGWGGEPGALCRPAPYRRPRSCPRPTWATWAQGCCLRAAKWPRPLPFPRGSHVVCTRCRRWTTVPTTKAKRTEHPDKTPAQWWTRAEAEMYARMAAAYDRMLERMMRDVQRRVLGPATKRADEKARQDKGRD